MAKIGMPTREQRSERARRRALEAPATLYEVRCHRCEVSFPVGTKRCMYCGGKPGGQPLFPSILHADPLEELAPMGEFQTREADSQPPPAPIEIDEEETETPRAALFRILGNLSWIIVFAAFTLYRSCTE